ncbi:LacI family DNA-binding transcriptional regulator [Martelella limonii]|uniref:LacI family DNA-binding transcriptional regulator n=1 Tax=Martelella limonii TaxID=1647649 RepID=UPI00157FDC30|nr:LacI family DNA-binding transcriptional regulator [Martelella limonii]
MAKRPTIIDVARHAGVSKSTVSLVLQNSALVKKTTRSRVEQSMQALNYVYNRTAANLRGAEAGLIGLVINDLRNPFFAEFAASAQMTFAEHGFATVIANTDEDVTIQAQVISSMVEHGVSALIISPAYGDEGAVFERIGRAGLPALQVLRMASPDTARFPFASLDYESGSLEAARHLVERGAQKIAFVGGLPDRAVTQERMAGYRAVLGDRAPITLLGRPTRAFGRDAALSLARDPRGIDAVLCFNDLVALGMMAGFAEKGIAVGHDIALVGFDDIEECALAYPKLSSVHCDIGAFGRDAAATMLSWLETGERPPERHLSPVTLMVRETSGGR